MSQPPSILQDTSLLLTSLARLTATILSLPIFPNRPTLPNDTVSITSQICAARRALESNLPPDHRLFSDPLAEALAGPSAMARARALQSAQPRIAVRTRYFDDFTESSFRNPASPPTQLVLLGAGMDTRAYRLHALQNATVFELDTAPVMDLKERLLNSVHPSPRLLSAGVRRVRVDLADDAWSDTLIEAGFQTTLPTVWLAEGLLYYLKEREVERIFHVFNRFSARGSALCFSAVTSLSESRKGIAKMFVSAMPDPAAFVAENGFQVQAVERIGGRNINYGRWKTERGEPIPVKGSAVCVTCLKV